MAEKTNPARRVLRTMRIAQKQPDRTASREAWATVLGVSPEDTSELLAAVADFFRLVDEARDELQALSSVDSDLYMKPFDRIHKALGEFNLQGQWQNFRRFLDPSTMTALEFCSDTLGQTWDEAVVDPAELSSLLEDVQALVLEVVESEIDPELKAVILDNLNRIEHAILAYELLGARGLRDAMESTLGSLFAVGEKLRNLPEDETKGKDAVRKFFVCIDRLNRLTAAARGVAAIASPIIKLLGGPDGG